MYKALFIDGIRNDQKSGGRTSTDLFLEKVCKYNTLYMQGLRLNDWKVFLFILNFPGPVFSLLNKLLPFSLFELFTKLSIVNVVTVLKIILSKNYDKVYLNHHSLFLLSFIINPKKTKVILICHDILNLKKQDRQPILLKFVDNYITCKLENYLLKRASAVIVFSYDDYAHVMSIGARKVFTLPIVDIASAKERFISKSRRFGLIGNWSRKENKDGAIEFFRDFTLLADQNFNGSFVIAGHGAASLEDKITNINPQMNVSFNDSYKGIRDLELSYLIAPINSGAGIKLKTLECVIEGIPVLGTPQAFTGLPPKCKKTAGIEVATVQRLALSIAKDNFTSALEEFDPKKFWDEYKKFIDKNLYDVGCVDV